MRAELYFASVASCCSISARGMGMYVSMGASGRATPGGQRGADRGCGAGSVVGMRQRCTNGVAIMSSTFGSTPVVATVTGARTAVASAAFDAHARSASPM